MVIQCYSMLHGLPFMFLRCDVVVVVERKVNMRVLFITPPRKGNEPDEPRLDGCCGARLLRARPLSGLPAAACSSQPATPSTRRRRRRQRRTSSRPSRPFEASSSSTCLPVHMIYHPSSVGRKCTLCSHSCRMAISYHHPHGPTGTASSSPTSRQWRHTQT